MLLEHTLNILCPLCDELIVVLNDAPTWSHLTERARLVSDYYPRSGVLGAISSGLRAATHPRALVVAADMPLLNPRLLQAMIEHPHDGGVLLPRWQRPDSTLVVEPLHAVYHQNCRPTLRDALEQGVRRVTDFLALVPVCMMEHAELARYDPQLRSFTNINTPQDLERLRALQSDE